MYKCWCRDFARSSDSRCQYFSQLHPTVFSSSLVISIQQDGHLNIHTSCLLAETVAITVAKLRVFRPSPSRLRMSCQFMTVPSTSPQYLPKPFLHRIRSSASYFNLQRRPFTLTSSSSCLHLHRRRPVSPILLSTFRLVHVEYSSTPWPPVLLHFSRSIQLIIFVLNLLLSKLAEWRSIASVCQCQHLRWRRIDIALGVLREVRKKAWFGDHVSPPVTLYRQPDRSSDFHGIFV